MGFFNTKKKEEENKMPAPPMPPAPVVNTPQPAAPVSEVPQAGKLSAPMIPGESSLSEIKTQVTTSNSSGIGMPNVQRNNEISRKAEIEQTQDDFNMENFQNEDSLFDISDLDLEESSENNFDTIRKTQQPIDTNIEREGKMNFITEKHHKTSVKDDIYYITTSQFKSLIEIVENVKIKIKEASETHLRLMDIKSEEDIEYENLRKIFQYMEDRLYEVDSLIFEK